jgi:hypothetical protein
MRARMIAFSIVARIIRTLRSALFVDSIDSTVEKIVVMMRTATEQRVDLKRYFGTFQSFLEWCAGLQTKRSQNCCDGTRRSIRVMG